MLPISILEKTSTGIIYEIPPGKPDPEQKCNIDKETRSRVLQSGLKGATCWYYAFNFLRKRIGKNPCVGLEIARAIEKACSQRRKEQAAYDNAFPVSIAELYSKSDARLMKKLNLKTAKLFLESQTSSSFALSETLEGRSSLIPYIKEFLREKKYKNMHEFLIYKRVSKTVEINIKFLSNFKTDIHKMTEHEHWKKFDIEQQAAVLDTYVRDLSADLYMLKKSSWKPLQGIDALCNALKEKGPLMILGDFGVSAYADEPFKMSQQINSRDIYAWSPGSERNKSLAGHAVLLVGSKKIQDKAFVYFIDPNDPSDPLDRSKQKIYMISFTNLTSNICDIIGHKKPDSNAEYAYYGDFKINT